MVAGSEVDRQMLERVAEVYKWLDMQICNGGAIAGACRSCGDCCDFDGFDHRLFITPPELIYLVENMGAENIKPMPVNRCPYNVDGECTIYEYRFAGCRIFCCGSNPDFQSRLSEESLKKFKSLCTEFKISYRYSDLATALDSLAGG